MRKAIFWSVLACMLGFANTTRAQEMLPTPNPLSGGPGAYSAPPGASALFEPDGSGVVPTGGTAPHHPPVPDDYILNRKCASCCGPLGDDGPIRSELYLQAGPSFPVGGGTFGDTLAIGWGIQGGARLMLFDPDMDAAWYVDLSGSNVWNPCNHQNVPIPLSVLLPDQFGIVSRVNFGQNGLPGLTLRDLNRTYVNLGLGRNWYFGGPASCGSGGGGCSNGSCGSGNCGCDNWTWRFGIDGGARYGTESVQFVEIRHRSDVIGGAFLGVHADMELPCGPCVYFGGLRAEYSYTWSDIFQRKSDLQEFLLLFNVGVRY